MQDLRWCMCADKGCTSDRRMCRNSSVLPSINAFTVSVIIYSSGTFRLWKNFKPMNSTTFVLFGKYYPIMDQLGSKDSSRDFQLNCVIIYFFTYIYYFMHESKDWCDGESEKILTFGVHLNKALLSKIEVIFTFRKVNFFNYIWLIIHKRILIFILRN
jgi:hypothetical protein